MNYMMIRTDDMLNGDGLRVVLFVTACNHYCKECHNPETWNKDSGFLFDNNAKELIYKELSNEYISGLTLSGGDPLNSNNLHDIYIFIKEVKENFPNKTIWIYTGYKYDNLLNSNFSEDKFRLSIIELCDVLVDGKFKKELTDVNYPWAGSTNQRIIDIQKTLTENKIVLKG